MEENNKKETAKMSYDELENVAAQLSQQVQHLHAKLQQNEVSNILSRLSILFKVLDNHKLFDPAFVHKCTKEIMDIITIPEDDNENE